MEAVLKTVAIEVRSDCIVVSPVWDGVDRPIVGGYGLKPGHMALARRLKNAIESGRAWMSTPYVDVDVNGQTFVHADVRFLMRRLNAELTKAGF